MKTLLAAVLIAISAVAVAEPTACQVAYWLSVTQTNQPGIDGWAALGPDGVMLNQRGVERWPYAFPPPSTWPTGTAVEAWCADRDGHPDPENLAPVVDTNATPTGAEARLLVDSLTMEVFAVVDSASPRRGWSQQQADYRSQITNRADIVTNLKALKPAMTNTIAQAQAAKAKAQALTQAGFAGTQSNTVKAVRAALIDTAQVEIDTAQAANQLRKLLLQYFKETEQ